MALILLLSIYISLFDLRHHRITNLSVLLISVLLFIEGDFHIYFLTGILFIVPLLLLGIFGGLGGGDVKLLMAVASPGHTCWFNHHLCNYSRNGDFNPNGTHCCGPNAFTGQYCASSCDMCVLSRFFVYAVSK